jgi:Rrf2 family protein
MLLSKRSLYGIRAALFMAAQPGSAYISVREISARLGISQHYLPKVLQDLTRAGITRSHRGPAGGIALTRPPADITLREIIVAVEGIPHPDQCPIAISQCSAEDPCTFCRRWKAARDRCGDLFDETTIADVNECLQLDALTFGATQTPMISSS